MKRGELKRRTPLSRTGTLGLQSHARLAAGEPKRRMRKCVLKSCRKPFPPRSMTHKACSPECAAEYARLERLRHDRAETKARLIALKPAKWAKAKAKKAMHLYVRLRDEGQSCASCDTILIIAGRIGGDYDAGHFRSVGSAAHLEFDPRNVWGQCKYCNDTLKGNGQEYERRLRIKMGDEYVDGILSDQTPRHYKKDDYLAIEAHYKQKIKELKA